MPEGMPEKEASQIRTSVWRSIATDVHFWVPAIVLLAGLLVLHWIR